MRIKIWILFEWRVQFWSCFSRNRMSRSDTVVVWRGGRTHDTGVVADGRLHELQLEQLRLGRAATRGGGGGRWPLLGLTAHHPQVVTLRAPLLKRGGWTDRNHAPCRTWMACAGLTDASQPFQTNTQPGIGCGIMITLENYNMTLTLTLLLLQLDILKNNSQAKTNNWNINQSGFFYYYFNCMLSIPAQQKIIAGNFAILLLKPILPKFNIQLKINIFSVVAKEALLTIEIIWSKGFLDKSSDKLELQTNANLHRKLNYLLQHSEKVKSYWFFNLI